MATSDPDRSGDSDFEMKVTEVRKEIEAHFRELIESARSREADLLKEVDNILGEYKGKVREKDQMQKELEKTKDFIKQNIQVTGLLDLQREIVAKIEERVQKIKKEIEAWEISFSKDKDIIKEVKKDGRISTRSSSNRLGPSVDYKNKLQAVRTFGVPGNAAGCFNSPWGVAVDEDTAQIFIVDHTNNRLQVFSQEGEYIYHFGQSMNNPIGVVIFQDKVFVTQFSGHCLHVYKVDGTFIRTVGSQGGGDGQLNSPYGIDINRTTGDIYICDAVNKRVQMFSQDLNFKQSLWTNSLSRPADVKLTEDSIFVLDESDLCMHMYNLNHALVKSIISRGPGKQTVRAFFFCFDADNNIYMTDYNTGRVNVFDTQGNSLHQFGNFSSTCGITLTENGTIIICNNATPCIQLW